MKFWNLFESQTCFSKRKKKQKKQKKKTKKKKQQLNLQYLTYYWDFFHEIKSLQHPVIASY